MKKNIQLRNKKRANNVKQFEHGPSLVTTIENGKTIEWNSWNKGNKQEPTKAAKAAMDENANIKRNYKQQVKQILAKAGYDPTINYTRKEKKHFTRIVKRNLFVKSIEQADMVRKEEPKSKTIPHSFTESLPKKEGKQRFLPAAEVNVKETPKERKFKFTINRRCANNPMKCYDFKTDYFTATTNKLAFDKAKSEAKKYEKDTSFAGITVSDTEGTGNITFYSYQKLLAA